jgi:hypothetical protein
MPATIAADDLARIFAARVVAGDQHAVRQALRHRTHLRPLARIAVAAAAENTDQIPAARRRRFAQHTVSAFSSASGVCA